MADLDRRVGRLEALIAQQDCACSGTRPIVIQRRYAGEKVRGAPDAVIAEADWTAPQIQAAVNAAYAPCQVHGQARKFLLFDTLDLMR